MFVKRKSVFYLHPEEEGMRKRRNLHLLQHETFSPVRLKQVQKLFRIQNQNK